MAAAVTIADRLTSLSLSPHVQVDMHDEIFHFEMF